MKKEKPLNEWTIPKGQKKIKRGSVEWTPNRLHDERLKRLFGALAK